ncbi:hypothetical protein, partial [Streptomyces sp. NPDC088270]|uniref:hypothetical protein n=1 Tax=Streptomyces sp. NPDC088270 TaxID=3160990 RepID=UPI00342995CC
NRDSLSRCRCLRPELGTFVRTQPGSKVRTPTALRKAIDRTELDARRHAAKEASVAFIAAAATLLSPDNR